MVNKTINQKYPCPKKLTDNEKIESTLMPFLLLKESAGTFRKVIASGNINNIKYMHSLGLPVYQDYINLAQTSEAIKWVASFPYIELETNLYNAVVRRGDLGALRALEGAGCPKNNNKVINISLKLGFFEITKWLILKGFPLGPSTVKDILNSDEAFEAQVLELLVNTRGKKTLTSCLYNYANTPEKVLFLEEIGLARSKTSPRKTKLDNKNSQECLIPFPKKRGGIVA